MLLSGSPIPIASSRGAYSDAVVGDGPSAYWPLSDAATSAQAEDLSGNGLNGDYATLKETSAGPNISNHQGYASDGTYHYTFHTDAIYKRNNDASWSVVVSNLDPFNGLPTVNHFGDGDYYNGKLYVPAQRWVSCGNQDAPRLLVFNAATMVREQVVDISAQSNDVAGLCVVPTDGANGIIYIVAFCDGTKIFKYDLATFAYLGAITVTGGSFTNAQGITHRDGLFYVSWDAGRISVVTKAGVHRVLFTPEVPGAEGLDYSQDDLRWLVDTGVTQTVRFLTIAHAAGPLSDGETAAVLDGISGHVYVPYTAGLAPTAAITFEGWAYRADWSTMTVASERLLSRTEAGGYALAFNDALAAGGQVGVFVRRNGAYGVASASILGLASGWHHFAGTYDGRFTRLYIDGALAATNDAGGSFVIQYSVTTPLIIGAEAGPLQFGGQCFTGRLAHVAIYSRALSATEIGVHYALRTSTVTPSGDAQITTTAPHGLRTGDRVYISGHTGDSADLDGERVITAIDTVTLSVPVTLTEGGTGGTLQLVATGADLAISDRSVTDCAVSDAVVTRCTVSDALLETA